MNKLLSFGAAALLLIYFSGCSAGRKMSFENKEVKPDYTLAKTVTISFLDKREEILAGKEKPSFCGHIYSAMQIGYNMQTESGRPLAEEFTTGVAKSLAKPGVKADPMVVPVNSPMDSILKKFSSHPSERLALFTIKKWESNATPRFSKVEYAIIYNLELSIYDQTGRLLADTTVNDIVINKKDAALNVKNLQALSNEVFRTQVNALLNQEAVRASLQ
jgi:hypothetical protein